MNKNINDLYSIAAKDERVIIGLMSGTSMDGLDIAVCAFKGHGSATEVEVKHFITAPYTDGFRNDIKAIFSRRDADLQAVCIMNAVIGTTHADLINKALNDWGLSKDSIDLIASHGQTIFHAPATQHKLEGYPNATLQIGDGDHIAVKTGVITLSDFRQKHIAAGGEGAPLAVYGDYLLFSKQGEERILLNIGGIANFTYLPADTDPSKIFSSDVGPGNTLMDQYVKEHFDIFYDAHAKIALSGTPDKKLLAELMKDDFFDKPLPKTTGPELFNLAYLKEAIQRIEGNNIPHEDVMATLCHFSAAGIVRSIKQAFKETNNLNIYMSGGGMHNPLLVQLLKEQISGASFYTTKDLAIEPDAKEAVLFAVLANEAVAGAPIDLGNRVGVPAVTMGKLSFPV